MITYDGVGIVGAIEAQEAEFERAKAEEKARKEAEKVAKDAEKSGGASSARASMAPKSKQSVGGANAGALAAKKFGAQAAKPKPEAKADSDRDALRAIDGKINSIPGSGVEIN